MTKSISCFLMLIASIGFLIPASTYGQVVTFDEENDFELSGDNTAPSDLGIFGIGSNTVAGTVVDALGSAPNVDVFTFEIAFGTQLESLVLSDFTSADDLAFIGIDDTDSFPFNAAELGSGPDQSQFIGGLLFGDPNAGTDILDDIGSTFGSGFTGPLGAGTYTVYLQQLGGTVVDYEFAFNVAAVPEPATTTFALFGLGAFVARRNRKR